MIPKITGGGGTVMTGLHEMPGGMHIVMGRARKAVPSRWSAFRYWNAIVGNGGAESLCSWCKDRWGFSWQIVPRALMAGMADPDPDPAAAKRVMETMMTMRKIDIARIAAARAAETTDA